MTAARFIAIAVFGIVSQKEIPGNFVEIAEWFETLAKAERSHAGRFQKALDGLEKL